MTFSFLPISKVTLLENNPRRITKEQFEKLCKNIKNDPQFFEARPCLINEVDGKFICYAGNQRLRAAEKLGWKEVPCHIGKDLSEEQQKKRIILDNVHHGEFDFDMLVQSYDMEELIDLGMLEKELGLIDHEVLKGSDEIPEEDNKKEKKCPNCGIDLN